MKPWEIVERISTIKNHAEILKSLSENDPFWVGASYAIDPFVGMIVRLPLKRNPINYGMGVHPSTFDKIVKAILSGELTGDKLVLTIEALSRACQEDEWVLWYKKILQGELDIPVNFLEFNKYCPDNYKIPLPALNKPKNITSIKDFPKRFFLQPLFPFNKAFWFIDSKCHPIEIRGYDTNIHRIRDSVVEKLLADFGRLGPIDIVLFGYMTNGSFMSDDILTRDNFTSETGIYQLYKRLNILQKLGIPITEHSPIITIDKMDMFFQELDLIFQQGFKGAILRDADGYYPFRKQCDFLIEPNIKTVVTCKEVIFGKGLYVEHTRGENVIKSFVRLGLTKQIWKDISLSSPVDKKLDVVSCGQKENELLLPKFEKWRN